MKTKVTLVSWTQHPIETVFYLWESARSNDKIPSVANIVEMCGKNEPYRKRVRETFEKVVDSAIPIAENLNFVFLLEGVSISFREQMVRHKVGVKVGERLGVEMFPDLHDSTWWAQSMRVLDMGRFVDDDLYRMPESIEQDEVAKQTYEDTLYIIQDAYKGLLARGVPVEDAREVIPLGAQHRVSWGMNLGAVIHVCRKRSCVIPQLGTWGPVIEGMIHELVTKVDPYFASIVTPPCIKGNVFKECLYKLDNERRVSREDPLLPCSLYLAQEAKKEPAATPMNAEELKRYTEQEMKYEKFWRRNTKTGVRLDV